MNILVTGGAGYVGTTLIPLLLRKKHRVRVLDNLTYGGNQLLSFFQEKNFELVKGDICSKSDVRDAVKGQDIVIHLAAIVGYPACRRQPRLAKETNIQGTRNLSRLTSKNQLILFASTESNYGQAETVVTEETLLHPLSLYGQSKTIAERFLLENSTTISFRFATGFGVSPRMRLDTLLNDFVYKALTQQYLVVYEKNFVRSFIHVYDMARAFLFAITHTKEMKGEVYNVGSENLMFSKKEICDKIKKQITCYVHYAEVGSDIEKRNYKISYEKIKSLGYKPTISIEEGIAELKSALNVITQYFSYTNV